MYQYQWIPDIGKCAHLTYRTYLGIMSTLTPITIDESRGWRYDTQSVFIPSEQNAAVAALMLGLDVT